MNPTFKNYSYRDLDAEASALNARDEFEGKGVPPYFVEWMRRLSRDDGVPSSAPMTAGAARVRGYIESRRPQFTEFGEDGRYMGAMGGEVARMLGRADGKTDFDLLKTFWARIHPTRSTEDLLPFIDKWGVVQIWRVFATKYAEPVELFLVSNLVDAPYSRIAKRITTAYEGSVKNFLKADPADDTFVVRTTSSPPLRGGKSRRSRRTRRTRRSRRTRKSRKTRKSRRTRY